MHTIVDVVALRSCDREKALASPVLKDRPERVEVYSIPFLVHFSSFCVPFFMFSVFYFVKLFDAAESGRGRPRQRDRVSPWLFWLLRVSVFLVHRRRKMSTCPEYSRSIRVEGVCEDGRRPQRPPVASAAFVAAGPPTSNLLSS